MSKRNETTRWKQLAELGAVRVFCKSYSILTPDLPIKWIQDRKTIRGAKDQCGPAIRFLFADNTVSKDFPFLTAIEVTLVPDAKNWKLVSAKLERNYLPQKPNTENWSFVNEVPEQVI